MTTAQKTWTAGDILTAADMNTYARGGQEMGYASVTTNQTGITTVVDVTGLSITWTAISSRVYELEAFVNVSSSAASDNVNVNICDSSNNQIQAAVADLSTTVGRLETISVRARVTGLSGSVTYKVRIFRNAGTGTLTVEAGATRPATFIVKDIGFN